MPAAVRESPGARRSSGVMQFSSALTCPCAPRGAGAKELTCRKSHQPRPESMSHIAGEDARTVQQNAKQLVRIHSPTVRVRVAFSPPVRRPAWDASGTRRLAIPAGFRQAGVSRGGCHWPHRGTACGTRARPDARDPVRGAPRVGGCAAFRSSPQVLLAEPQVHGFCFAAPAPRSRFTSVACLSSSCAMAAATTAGSRKATSGKIEER